MDSTRDDGGHDTGWRQLQRKLELLTKPVPAMAALFVVIALALTFLGIVGAPKDTLRMEWAKALLDAGVVGIAGTFLAYVVEKHGRNIERQQKQQDDDEEKRVRDIEARKIELRYREELLKSTARRITSSYNKSKGARRMARARGLSPDHTRVRVAAYDEFMRELNDAQLELEAVKRDLKTSKEDFPSDAAVEECAEAMEKYLGAIISEYEGHRPKASGPDGELALVDLGSFAKFVDPDDKTDFKEYAKPHGTARDAINKELLGLTSAKNAMSKSA